MPRGRPRKISTSDALHSVMIAFWENGYSGTSMNDLAAASGMAKPGLYAAFGDKEALFEKALVYYFESYGGPVFARLQSAEKHVLEDFRDFLGAVASVTLDPELPFGCFLVNSFVECAYGSDRHRELIMGLRDSRYTSIRQRLLKAIAAGEVPEGTDTHRVSTFIEGQFNAIALLGRSGSTQADLEGFIETGLRSIPVVGSDHVFDDDDLNLPILQQ